MIQKISFFYKFKIMMRECLAGSTLNRTMHNIYLINLDAFQGRGIDFGARNGAYSYYRFIDIDNAFMTYTDFYAISTKDTISIDFEEDFCLSQKKFDFALCMNTLEHVFNHQNFLGNIAKSLRKGGRLEGFVPFLHYYHGVPDDWFRYTHSSRATNERKWFFGCSHHSDKYRNIFSYSTDDVEDNSSKAS